MPGRHLRGCTVLVYLGIRRDGSFIGNAPEACTQFSHSRGGVSPFDCCVYRGQFLRVDRFPLVGLFSLRSGRPAAGVPGRSKPFSRSIWRCAPACCHPVFDECVGGRIFGSWARGTAFGGCHAQLFFSRHKGVRFPFFKLCGGCARSPIRVARCGVRSCRARLSMSPSHTLCSFHCPCARVVVVVSSGFR